MRSGGLAARLVLLAVLLLAAASLAVQVTIRAVDASTGEVLNKSTIMLWGANGLIEVSSGGVLTADLEPGTYLVRVLAFGRSFNQTIYVPSTNPIDIKIPTAFITALVINDANGSLAEWPVVVLSPSGSQLGSGVGKVVIEVLADGSSYTAEARTPYGIFSNSTTPSPGGNYTVVVHVPTSAVHIGVADYWGNPVNCTVELLANGTIVASGSAPLNAVVLSSTYTISIDANISGVVLRYNETADVPPGRYNRTVRLPTAELYVYPQTPQGAPLRNATVVIYQGGRVVFNSTGPQRLVLLAGTYVVAARYGNSTDEAVVELQPGNMTPVYLNLSTTIGKVVKVTPTATVTTTAATTTARPRTTTSSTPPPATATSATTSAPRKIAGNAWGYALAALGSLAAALASGVLALSLIALKSAEDLGPPELVESSQLD